MREIPLTKGYVAHVDDCDYVRLSAYKWYASVRKHIVYAVRSQRIHGTTKVQTVHMHRIILDAPTGMHVDHIDHNGLHNVRSNLRLCTSSQNAHNRRTCNKNTSGVKGVSFEVGVGKWRAIIQCKGKVYIVGYFPTKEEAAQAVRKKRQELHGEYGCDM